MAVIPIRIEASDPDALPRARRALDEGEEVVLQYAYPPYPPDALAEINGLCRAFGPRVEVRFYAHHGSTFDCRTLAALPDVASLAINCLSAAENEDVLGELPRLERLNFGVVDLPSGDVLRLLDPTRIRRLFLDETRRKNIDLTRLSTFERLESLFVNGHTRGIDAIGDLATLTELRLRSIPKSQSLAFVGRANALRSLELILGGREHVDDVASSTLEELEIHRIRNLATFPNLAQLPMLRSLSIFNQPRLEEASIAPGSAPELTSLDIAECRALRSIAGLAEVPRLDTLRIVGTSLDVDAVIDGGLPPSLSSFQFIGRSEKESARARRSLEAAGFADRTSNDA